MDPLRLGLGAFASTYSFSTLSVLADGEIAYCGSIVGALSQAGALAPFMCYALLGDPRQEHLIADDVGLYRYDVATSAYVQEQTGYYWALAGDLTSAWAASPIRGLQRRSGGTWAPASLPDQHRVLTVAGTSATPVYATSYYAGVYKLWSWDGGQWNEITTTRRETRPPDGTLFVMDQTGLVSRLDGSTLTPILTAIASGLVAVSHDEVYLTDGSDRVLHWNNGVQSYVRLTAGPLAITPTEIVGLETGNQLYIVPRLRMLTAGYNL